MSALMNRITITGAVAAVAVPVIVAGAPAAMAKSAYGCTYPYVCVYEDSTVNSGIVERFRQATGSWRYSRNPQSKFAVWNTRNDDVAYLLIRYGSRDYVSCVVPNNGLGSIGTLRAVRISSRSTCAEA